MRQAPREKRLLAGLVYVLLLAGASVSVYHFAAVPGLPFTEDFSDTSLRDDAQTNANWSTDEQALLLSWREKRFGAFGPGVSGFCIALDVLGLCDPCPETQPLLDLCNSCGAE